VPLYRKFSLVHRALCRSFACVFKAKDASRGRTEEITLLSIADYHAPQEVPAQMS
jgi:hypothetical protein